MRLLKPILNLVKGSLRQERGLQAASQGPCPRPEMAAHASGLLPSFLGKGLVRSWDLAQGRRTWRFPSKSQPIRDRAHPDRD